MRLRSRFQLAFSQDAYSAAVEAKVRDSMPREAAFSLSSMVSPSFGQRIAIIASPKAATRRVERDARLVQNRYEAGQLWSSRRSYLPGWTRDARFDADSATCTEIRRKARYFERNNAIVNRLADLFEQY